MVGSVSRRVLRTFFQSPEGPTGDQYSFERGHQLCGVRWLADILGPIEIDELVYCLLFVAAGNHERDVQVSQFPRYWTAYFAPEINVQNARARRLIFECG